MLNQWPTFRNSALEEAWQEAASAKSKVEALEAQVGEHRSDLDALQSEFQASNQALKQAEERLEESHKPY